MGRAPCCDKASVRRGPWSPEEDKVLKSYVEKHGTGGNWIALPQKAGLKRCGKSCRLRWLNYLRPDIKHGGFTDEENHIICSLYGSIGSRWSVIASHLPGRTDNDVKNHWNTKLKKRLQMAGAQVDASADGSQTARVRRSPSAATSACNGSSPSTLSSAEEAGLRLSEPATSLAVPIPADPLRPLVASEGTSAASSSLAMDYSSSYLPWFEHGSAVADAFLVDVEMEAMESSHGGYDPWGTWAA